MTGRTPDKKKKKGREEGEKINKGQWHKNQKGLRDKGLERWGRQKHTQIR